MGSMWYRTVVFDISTKYRDGDFVFLEKDSAIELLRPLEEAKKSYTRIRFRNHSFGVEAARVAKRALLKVRKTLRDVEFVHFVYGRSDDEALEVMREFSSALEGSMLRSLILDLGEMGEKGVEAFTQLLKSQKALENLKVKMSSNISVEATGAIFELLPSIERIDDLYFIYYRKETDSAEALFELVKKCIALDIHFSENSKWVALEDNKFSLNSNLGMWDGADVVLSFGEGSSLAMFDIESNRCGLALRPVISGYLSPTEVDIMDMKFQDKRMIPIARGLKNTAPYLRVLIVGGNCITPKAAPALAECVAAKNLLTVFSAEDNKLEDKGSVVICKALSEGHEQLEELDLSANGMTGIGAKAAAEAVAKKPNFNCLDISENFITEEEIATVKDLLRSGNKDEYVLTYKDVGAMQYEKREEGPTDSDTESDDKWWLIY